MKASNTALAVIAMLSVSTTAPVLAAAREPVSVAVSTDGLDLSTTEGAARMRTRAFAAITEACTPEVWGIKEHYADRRCRSEMRQDVLAKLADRERGAPSVSVGPESGGGL